MLLIVRLEVSFSAYKDMYRKGKMEIYCRNTAWIDTGKQVNINLILTAAFSTHKYKKKTVKNVATVAPDYSFL